MLSHKKRHQSYTLLYAQTAGREWGRSNKKKAPQNKSWKTVSEAEMVPLPVTLKKTLTNKKCSTTVFKKQGTVLLKGWEEEERQDRDWGCCTDPTQSHCQTTADPFPLSADWGTVPEHDSALQTRYPIPAQLCTYTKPSNSWTASKRHTELPISTNINLNNCQKRK